jgi:hypothetical protein
MFNLSAKIETHPMNDKPYIRHLQTADLFNECEETRRKEAEAFAAVQAAIIAHADAVKRKEAAIAKAKLLESMEGL